MYKVRILMTHHGAIIVDGKTIVRDCYEGEDVFKSELNIQDIKNGFYRPYKNQILDTNGQTSKERKRPEIKNEQSNNKIIEAIQSLEQAVKSASNVLRTLKGSTENQNLEINRSENKINGIPESLFVEEGQEIIKPFGQAEYESNMNQIHEIIKSNMKDTADRELITMSFSKPKIPIFAEMNQNKNIEGELLIEDQNIMPDKRDIFDINPIIEVVKDENGKIDVLKSLKLEVIGA